MRTNCSGLKALHLCMLQLSHVAVEPRTYLNPDLLWNRTVRFLPYLARHRYYCYYYCCVAKLGKRFKAYGVKIQAACVLL